MEGKGVFKNLMVFIAGVLGLVYLINPTAGVFELIPDNFPIVGNLDEAAAAALVLAALRYYGIDLLAFLGKGIKEDNGSKETKEEAPPPAP